MYVKCADENFLLIFVQYKSVNIITLLLMAFLHKIQTKCFYFSLFLMSRFHGLPNIYFWVIHVKVIVTIYGLYRWTSYNESNLHIDTSIHFSILIFALTTLNFQVFLIHSIFTIFLICVVVFDRLNLCTGGSQLSNFQDI